MSISEAGDEGVEEEAPEREAAAAMLMAGRHLPAEVTGGAGERLKLVKEASRMFEIIGDRKSVSLCRKTLKDMDESASNLGGSEVSVSS